MTESTGAACPTCSTTLSAVGAPCPRCSPGSSPYAPPQYSAPQYSAPQYPAPQYAAPQPYQPGFAPYQQAPYQQAPYPGTAYPPAPYLANPAGVRAPKSAGIAILLTLLWIGAGHLYLDRLGTGFVLMGAHFVVGFMLFIIFAPLGFLVWLAAVIGCCVWCSNLTGQINAGTVPPRETW